MLQDVYAVLEANSVALQAAGLPKMTLPVLHGFKSGAKTGGFMMASAVSLADVDSMIVEMNEMYAGFTYSEDNPFYPKQKVSLDIKRIAPKVQEAFVYRVLDQICKEK